MTSIWSNDSSKNALINLSLGIFFLMSLNILSVKKIQKFSILDRFQYSIFYFS